MSEFSNSVEVLPAREVKEVNDELHNFTTIDLSTPKTNISNRKTIIDGTLHLKQIDTKNSGYHHSREYDASTTRTEMSTEIDEFSIKEKFSFYSAHSFAINTAPAASYDTHFTAACEGQNTYGASSLLDLDEDDECSESGTKNSPLQQLASTTSMYIGSELHSESRIGFYGVPDDNVYEFSTVMEEPPTYQEVVGPSLSCDEDAYEFDWLSEETNRIEEKKRQGEEKTWARTCDNDAGFKNNFNAFVSRCVSGCFVPDNS